MVVGLAFPAKLGERGKGGGGGGGGYTSGVVRYYGTCERRGKGGFRWWETGGGGVRIQISRGGTGVTCVACVWFQWLGWRDGSRHRHLARFE